MGKAVLPNLFHQQKGAEGEGIYACTVEAADGAAGIGDEGLAKEIERGVDENGGRSGFTKFVEEFPEERIGLLIDGVNTHFIAVKSEAFETGDRFCERSERGHGQAIGGGIEILRSEFSGYGKSEWVKTLAMLDELIDVFNHVFGEGRSEQAAIAESAVTEFGAALAPGNDFIAVQESGGFVDGLLFA